MATNRGATSHARGVDGRGPSGLDLGRCRRRLEDGGDFTHAQAPPPLTLFRRELAVFNEERLALQGQTLEEQIRAGFGRHARSGGGRSCEGGGRGQMATGTARHVPRASSRKEQRARNDTDTRNSSSSSNTGSRGSTSNRRELEGERYSFESEQEAWAYSGVVDVWWGGPWGPPRGRARRDLGQRQLDRCALAGRDGARQRLTDRHEERWSVGHSRNPGIGQTSMLRVHRGSCARRRSVGDAAGRLGIAPTAHPASGRDARSGLAEVRRPLGMDGWAAL